MQEEYRLREQSHKQRVLSSGIAAAGWSLTDAVVIKHGNIFFVCRPDGSVPMDEQHGFGLYYNDTRYLDGYELRINDHKPNVVVASDELGHTSVTRLTNPEIELSEDDYLPGNELGIRIVRVADEKKHMLHEQITLRNYGVDPMDFRLSIRFRARFEDVYVVRGWEPKKKGRHHDPEWRDDVLRFAYDGADGLARSLHIYADADVDDREETGAGFEVHLGPGETREITITYVVEEASEKQTSSPSPDGRASIDELESVLQRGEESWMEGFASIESDSILLNKMCTRSFRDLYVMRSHIGEETYYSAGLPWFGTLYGRDSVIAVLQVLAYRADLAEETLRILAAHQGTDFDKRREEQPGKILHELRVGEMTRCEEIPHSPYFGTVDATPLFLMLFGRHAAWTGDLRMFNELRASIEASLNWIDEHGDYDGDGYIEYDSSPETWLVNQGWKDSGDAMVNADGSLAEPPIALIEAQAYVYMAKHEIANLFERSGDAERGRTLRDEAEALRERINRDYWIPELSFYAMTLQKDNRPTEVITSNPGHALWAGVPDEDRARLTAERMMQDDMFSGWGVRTLSSKEKRYNPLGYHLGMVWPVDNAVVAAGFRRYGHDDAAARIVDGMISAGMHFESRRLPEVFGGFRKEEYHVPGPYPVACHPQAWSAGAIPYMLKIMLGLVPEGFDNRLRVVRPRLPHITNVIEMRNIRVARGSTDLRFTRNGDGADVEVLRTEGGLEVVVEE